jgi:hypothetical protein
MLRRREWQISHTSQTDHSRTLMARVTDEYEDEVPSSSYASSPINQVTIRLESEAGHDRTIFFSGKQADEFRMVCREIGDR